MYHICMTLDSNYLIHTIVTIKSIFSNSINKYHFHFIVDDESRKKYNHLKFIISFYGSSCDFYEINNSDLEKAKIDSHITIATYYRLLIARIIPTTVDKLLFLDSDLIILSDISELFSFTLNNNAIAIVEEPISDTHKITIGLSLSEVYFNAGVMLINLNYWRKNNLTKKFINYLNNSYDKIRYWDQDVLNAVIKDKIILDTGWNVTESNFLLKFINSPQENIKILHYTGKCKPWNCRTHPLSYMYFKYLLTDNHFISKILYLPTIRKNIKKYFSKFSCYKLIIEIIFSFMLLFFPKNLFFNFYFKKIS